MTKLILMRDGESQIEYELTAQETIIGRTQECDITISDDAVSRQHIRVICILGDCFMEDMGSVNGVMLNRRLTKKSPLADGDVISIGRHDLKYVVASEVSANKEDYDKTRIFLMQQLGDSNNSEVSAESMDLGAGSDGTEGSTETIEKTAKPTLALELEPKDDARTYAEAPMGRCGVRTIISDKNGGTEMSLEKEVTGIGRSGRRIAAITRRSQGYFLVPLEVDGPDYVVVKVNGEIVGRQIYPLCSNDMIEFGKIKMEFNFA